MQANCLDATSANLFNLHRSSHRSSIDLSTLSTLQRIILTTDGTLTKILEAYLSEEIQIIKLSERAILAAPMPWLELERGDEVLERKILLQGKTSKRNFVYAESLLVLNRLDKPFRNELLNSEISLGRLMLAHRMETFKEIIISAKESPDELSTYFQMNSKDELLSRSYRLFYRYEPIMIITEKFPEHYFL